mgnify:CR=1 FL=1
MILACHNISKAFGEQVIVKSGSFHIEDREKTALIGPNGTGKSTILKMIMKELDTDKWRYYPEQRKDNRLSVTASGAFKRKLQFMEELKYCQSRYH